MSYKKYLILYLIIICSELGKLENNQFIIDYDMCGYVNNNDYKRNICLLNCLNDCPSNNNNPNCSIKCDKFCCSLQNKLFY